jgi:preprotein translocase subunit YajC
MEIIYIFEFLCSVIPLILVGIAWYMLIAKELLNQEKGYEIVESDLKPGKAIILNNDKRAIVVSCMKSSIIVEDEEGVYREVYKQEVKCING